MDSPLYAGLYYQRIDLSPASTDIVHLNIFADAAGDLQMTPEELEAHKKLVVGGRQTLRFAPLRPLRFSAAAQRQGRGSRTGASPVERGRPARELPDRLAQWRLDRDLLGHEYTHSWNGKFRRPADLWTPNYNVPMRDDLLWIYEGLTQYWGNVLTARAGMRTPEQTRDVFARVAANFADSAGRDWRPLVDTTNQPIISERRPVSWVSYQRPEDYYTEGELIWLDADTKIRELTGGKKSLDDFAKGFFGVYSGSFITDQYTLDDVVKDLNEVVPYDWKTFFEERVYDLHPQVPTNGFTQGGYKLVYTDKPTDWIAKDEASIRVRRLLHFSRLLGGYAAEEGCSCRRHRQRMVGQPGVQGGYHAKYDHHLGEWRCLYSEGTHGCDSGSGKGENPLQLQFRHGNRVQNDRHTLLRGHALPIARAH